MLLNAHSKWFIKELLALKFGVNSLNKNMENVLKSVSFLTGNCRLRLHYSEFEQIPIHKLCVMKTNNVSIMLLNCSARGRLFEGKSAKLGVRGSAAYICHIKC